jgi:hypothetical protein
VTAVLPLTISTTESFYPFLVPILFSVAIPLTCFDRITTKKKYQAFVLSAMLTIILFFFSVMFGIFLGQSFLGEYSIFAISALAGLLTLLSLSITIKIDNLKFGLILTSLFALAVPLVAKYLKGQKIFNIEFFGDPATFFIVWQTIIGFAIAISIWTKTNVSKAINK